MSHHRNVSLWLKQNVYRYMVLNTYIQLTAELQPTKATAERAVLLYAKTLKNDNNMCMYIYVYCYYESFV